MITRTKTHSIAHALFAIYLDANDVLPLIELDQ